MSDYFYVPGRCALFCHGDGAMHTKVVSLSFSVDSKDSSEIFKNNSVYDLTFKEGISSLYSGSIELYSTEAIKASDLSALMGKPLTVKATISDELADPSTKLSRIFNFDRYIDGTVCGVNFLGDTQEVTTGSNDTVYQYRIDFNCPYSILSKKNYSFKDEKIGAVKDKLEKLLSEPSKVVFGSDHDTSDELPIKYILIDSDNAISKLSDSVTLQIGSYSPLSALRQILIDYGLNFNIHHSSDAKSGLKVFLSKGYGVSTGHAVESAYFSGDSKNLKNYEDKMVISCNKGSEGDPKLNSVKIEVLNQDCQTSPLSNSFLIFASSSNQDAEVARAKATAESEKNYLSRQKRENLRYLITASHLIFTPGTVINTVKYVGDNVKLIVDSVSLHIANVLSSGFRSVQNSEPSIESRFVAYELDPNSDPGSFSESAESGISILDSAVATVSSKTADTAVTQSATAALSPIDISSSAAASIKVLEATVSDGDGKYSGVWDSTSNEPRANSICICTGNDTTAPSMFYALPDSFSTPVCVRLTSFSGFNDSFTFPRIGQRILILCSDNSYYLHSFLTPGSSTAVSTSDRDSRNNTMASIKMLSTYDKGARVHIWNSQDKSKNVGIAGFKVEPSSEVLSDVILEKNTSIRELLKNKILSGTESSVVEAMVLQTNTYVAYKAYDDETSFDTKYLPSGEKLDDHKNLKEKTLKDRCRKSKKSFDAASAEVKEKTGVVKDIESQISAKSREKKLYEAQSSVSDQSQKKKAKKKVDSLTSEITKLNEKLADAQKSLDTKKGDLKLAETDINAVTDEFKEKIGVPEDFGNNFSDVFKIDHNGNMEINVPSGTLTINARNVKISAAESASISGTGSVTVSTTNKVAIGSRGSTITVAPNAVKISSLPFVNGVLTSFGSSLTLDSFSGASIAGPTFAAKTKFSASMSDNFGGSIKTSKGISSVKGIEASLGTSTIAAYVENIVKFDAGLASELVKSAVSGSGHAEAGTTFDTIFNGVAFPAVSNIYDFFIREGNTLGKYVNTVGDYHKVQKDVATRNAAKNKTDPKEEVSAATIGQFFADTCDFCCDLIDIISAFINVAVSIATVVDKNNVFARAGFNHNTRAQNIKFVASSMKYTLNTMAAHAIGCAEPWGIKPAKFALKGGKISSESIEEVTKNWKSMNARVP